jgi:hypothetical protein
LARWPLHPQPHAYESLNTYARRLAEAYEVRLETFGRRALGIEAEVARDLNRAPRPVLERLSAGTGVSLDRLESMRGDRLWARLVDELGRILATDEGRKVLARFQATVLSRNS